MLPPSINLVMYIFISYEDIASYEQTMNKIIMNQEHTNWQQQSFCVENVHIFHHSPHTFTVQSTHFIFTPTKSSIFISVLQSKQVIILPFILRSKYLNSMNFTIPFIHKMRIDYFWVCFGCKTNDWWDFKWKSTCRHTNTHTHKQIIPSKWNIGWALFGMYIWLMFISKKVYISKWERNREKR